ncbi:MAG: hypothetical protein V1769_06775, partial [Thermoplasmatota archaeon]
MSKDVRAVLLAILLVIMLNVPIVIGQNNDELRNNFEKPKGILSEDKGKRWDIRNVTILYLNGTFYEMGRGLGNLVKQEISLNTRAFR